MRASERESNNLPMPAVYRQDLCEMPEDSEADERQFACEVTVLYPCLNEEDAIGTCVDDAMRVLKESHLDGEVLVVDNASTDRSAEIAADRGARVVTERRRGYGSAYLRGFQEARGRYVVMLDADSTYPVEMIPDFVQRMRDGAEMVIGNRFAGMMESDAMPLLNRYVGNPILSGMTHLLFRVSLKDIHCGMRGIRTDVVPKLALQAPGMEFATEMIVKALDFGVDFVEIGIPYRPRTGDSKLNPLRDAWRHVEYMLVFSPVTLFLLPGVVLWVLGMLIQLTLISGPTHILFRTWHAHTNLAGLAFALTGVTLFVLGVVSASLAWSVRMRFRHSPIARVVAMWRDGWLRAAGTLFALIGAGLWLYIVAKWAQTDFQRLSDLPVLSLATTLFASGLELFGAAFLVHVQSLKR